MKTNFTLRAIVSALAVAGATFAVNGFAAQHTDTMAVSATVVDSCMVVGGAVAFGNVDPFGAGVAATGDITTLCTTGTVYRVGLGAGNSVGATTSTRKMTNATTTLNYGLFSDPAHAANFDDIGTAGIFTGTGSGLVQHVPVYGLVPGNQSTVIIGAYTDVVNVTVDF
jgi:spore coat protein U-like protein